MSERLTLTFLTGRRRFNYRVAAVIIRDNHVLVCREDDDDYVMLPGGRVEFGEASDVALVREIGEELNCVGEAGGLLFSVENLFEREGENFHEIGKYYAADLPDGFPFQTDQPALVTHDEGHELKFYWVSISGDALAKMNLMPKWIVGRLADLPDRTEYLIEDER